jgi:anaerobic magnesium-protoporphyrin IX monomethyl ester cyclase
MRVTLVYHGRYVVRQALELETLASVIRSRGHHVELVYEPDTFGVTDNLLQIPRLARLLSSPERIQHRIEGTRPDVIVFSVLPGSFRWSVQIASAAKDSLGVPTAFIGLHPSVVPERVMREPAVDYAIQGEVENVIHPLLDALRAGCDVGGVKNLWYRSNGEVVHTPRAELVDLDALPLPDKDLFRPYVTQNCSYAAMVSRGCPYRCSFCEETCSRDLYGGGRYFRRKSVDSVMAELVAGKKRYRYREVIFKDSYLSGNREWLAALMDRYRREIGVPFKCFCTISGFDAETARLLRQGGCYSIEFGLQTWNADIRRNVLHRVETNEGAIEAFRHCADQKLWYDVDHMFNLPFESERDHIEAARCYRRLPYLNRVKVHFLVYLPTAEIVARGMETGALPGNAPELLADGRESDFYDQHGVSEERRRSVAGFAALFKLLPIIPERVLEWLLQGRRVGTLRRIPSPLMALLQGAIAMRSGDLRFLAYMTTYPAKVTRSIAARLRSIGARRYAARQRAERSAFKAA